MKFDPATRESIATELHRFAAPMLAADDVYFFPRIETSPARDFDRAIYGDLIVPKDALGTPSGHDGSATLPGVESRPAILFLHGGCWRFGSPSQFYHQSIRLAQDHGFVCLNLDYRMTGEAPYPAALHDSADGIVWLRSHASQFGIDPGRVAVCGGSAGGHLASMLATGAGSRPVSHAAAADFGGATEDGEPTDTSRAAVSWPNAAVLINGEFDMWDLLEKGSLIGPMEAFFGGSPEQHRELYDENSSVHAIDGHTCPTLLLHGTEDNCVSHEQSVAFHQRLRDCGVRGEIEIYQGKPHGWFNDEPDRSETYERMRRFLVDVFSLSHKV